jgi:hypothetical protein
MKLLLHSSCLHQHLALLYVQKQVTTIRAWL